MMAVMQASRGTGIGLAYDLFKVELEAAVFAGEAELQDLESWLPKILRKHPDRGQRRGRLA